MKTYRVYFECYGKKLRVDKQAETEEQAKKMVIDAIVFHKVSEITDENTAIVNDFKIIRESLAAYKRLFNIKKAKDPTDTKSDELMVKLEEMEKELSVQFELIDMLEVFDDGLKEIEKGGDGSKFQQRLEELAKKRGIKTEA